MPSRSQLTSYFEQIRQVPKQKDPSFIPVLLANCVSHLALALWLWDKPYWLVLLCAIVAGPAFHSALITGYHEVCHENYFPLNIWKKIRQPFLLAINIPIFAPIYCYFYSHRYHHAYLGTKLDYKYPKSFEWYDKNIWTRMAYLAFQPVLLPWSSYVRWIYSKQPDFLMPYYCTFLQLLTHLLLYDLYGFRPVLYLFISGFLNSSFLIQGSRNLADHSVDEELAHTFSYYGRFNLILHNLGYHREHHDFPLAPGRYLPLLTHLGAPFYLQQDKQHIVNSLYSGLLEDFRAPYGQGLTRHEPKLTMASD